MHAVLAGWACGFALVWVVTPMLSVALLRAGRSGRLFGRPMPDGARLTFTVIIVHVFALVTLTALGIVFGLILGGIEDRRPAGGFGSPNAVYTALTVGIVAIAVAPLAVALPRLRAALLGTGLVVAGVFGWATPYLAELGA